MHINYLQVYDYDLNISKSLNKAVKNLDEWICLTDQDTLKFPSFMDNLKDVLSVADESMLIGSTTNRLRPSNPQVIQELFNESDINKHFDYAKEAFDTYGTELVKTNLIAGSCMIFHKSLWEKVGGFDEDKIFFDKYFSYKVNNCYIAKGLYIFHLYRWGADDPVSSVQHLVKP